MTSIPTIRMPKPGIRFLKNIEAASFLGVEPEELTTSRKTGYLLGLEAPPFLIMGRYTRYDLIELMVWSRLYNIGGPAK